jgi:hypothetical protein
MKYNWIIGILLLLPATLFPQSFVPPQRGSDPLYEKAFILPETNLRSNLIPIEYVIDRLPNREAWRKFFSVHGKCAVVMIDTKAGTPGNVACHLPIIPGMGAGNTVTLQSLSAMLGYPITSITNGVVANVFRLFVIDKRELLAIDVNQLGQPSAFQVSSDLWQTTIAQQANEIPVRGSRVGGTISHGNLVVFGLTKWKDVQISLTPEISATQAYDIGFDYVGGKLKTDKIWKEATLEIIPIDTGGQTYGHRLVWVFGFKRVSFHATWELLIDAHTGQVVAFQDVNKY